MSFPAQTMTEAIKQTEPVTTDVVAVLTQPFDTPNGTHLFDKATKVVAESEPGRYSKILSTEVWE